MSSEGFDQAFDGTCGKICARSTPMMYGKKTPPSFTSSAQLQRGDQAGVRASGYNQQTARASDAQLRLLNGGQAYAARNALGATTATRMYQTDGMQP